MLGIFEQFEEFIHNDFYYRRIHMIVDGHTHISTDGKNYYGSLEVLKKEMERTKTDKVVAFPLSEKFESNLELAEIAKENSFIIPLAFINPHDSNCVDRFKECIEEHHMCGLKLHPTLSNFHIDDRELLDGLLTYCNEHSLNIVIHCSTDDHRVHPYRIETMAKLYPNATFQIAHMGAIWATNAAVEVAKRNENVFLDTGIASVSATRRALEQVPEKVIMGCDFPFYSYDLEQLKIDSVLRYSNVENKDLVRNMVMGENCLKLYKENL